MNFVSFVRKMVERRERVASSDEPNIIEIDICNPQACFEAIRNCESPVKLIIVNLKKVNTVYSSTFNLRFVLIISAYS